MRPTLLSSPKVNGIVRELESREDVCRALSTGFNGTMSEIVTRNVMRNVTVASLLCVWGAANEHTEDGVFYNADISDIDDIAGIPGFGEAMQAVGWAIYDPAQVTVTLPNFGEWNTTGKTRNAERQRRYRERQKGVTSDVTRDVTVTPQSRGEESREESIPVGDAGASAEQPKEYVWRVGVDLLRRAGEADRSARSFLGKLCKEHGDEAVRDAVGRAVSVAPAEPKAWLKGALTQEVEAEVYWE